MSVTAMRKGDRVQLKPRPTARGVLLADVQPDALRASVRWDDGKTGLPLVGLLRPEADAEGEER